jgi:phosphatidylglycerol:prolipoprotein diacylglycerol transferase
MITAFGLFLVLAFAAAYFTFRAEYKRKETEGLIHPFTRTIGSTHPFTRTARSIPLSESTHPYQLMDPLLLYCGLFGFAGAIGFAFFENPRHIGFNGLNFYGALIAGTLVYLYINRRYGIRPAIAADIGSPGMMLAYAIGRMGCHLAGDGDWGIINKNPRPSWLHWLPDWAWAYRYPHNTIHQGSYIPGCTGNYCTELTIPVYPTPLYESIICFLLFFLLWRLRRTDVRKRAITKKCPFPDTTSNFCPSGEPLPAVHKPGRLFAIFAILNGAERFLIEFIRVTPRYSIGHWNVSQAQLLALGWIAAGLLTLLLSTRKIYFNE